jgi:hypothetical protein
MRPLSADTSDADLIAHVDQWAALLEAERYEAAFAFTDHDPSQRWTPDLIRQVIKAYGNASASQKATVEGKPTDICQRKEVTRWSKNARGSFGEVWYDLNIDGFASDLTATFWISESSSGLTLRLNDIHVM